MKRAAVYTPVLAGLGTAFFFLLAAVPASAQDEEEQEGTQEQVEAEDNVTICVTEGVAKDGDKDLIVFDKDNPDEEWEVNARVKFRPKPEKEYILRDKKFNWTASEGYTVSKADDARPKIKATAEAAGTEGKLKLHLSWEEEKLDEDDNPTGEIKIHPWSNDKASMRLLVPEFELQSVSYNLGDNGATGALPFYDNSNTPELIQAPEYVKNDTRSADNVGVLYKKGMTPKMRARFTIKPSTAGGIVLFANQQGQSLIPTAQSDENAKLSGTTKETYVTCVSSLPNVIRSGVAEHVWKWSVYGRLLEPKDSQNQNDNRDSGYITSNVNNVFIVLNNPNKKTQDPWINCMKYGIEKLNAEGATSNQEVLRRIVPNFRSTTCYPPKNEYGSHQLSYGVMDSYVYQAYPNISHLYNTTAYVNCYDSSLSTYVVTQYLGCVPKRGQVYETIDVEVKDPWWRRSIAEDTEYDTDKYGTNWTKTWHTYLVFGKRYIYDPTPVWANTPSSNGPAQEGILTPAKYYEYMNVRHDLDSYWRRGKLITPNLSW